MIRLDLANVSNGDFQKVCGHEEAPLDPIANVVSQSHESDDDCREGRRPDDKRRPKYDARQGDGKQQQHAKAQGRDTIRSAIPRNVWKWTTLADELTDLFEPGPDFRDGSASRHAESLRRGFASKVPPAPTPQEIDRCVLKRMISARGAVHSERAKRRPHEGQVEQADAENQPRRHDEIKRCDARSVKTHHKWRQQHELDREGQRRAQEEPPENPRLLSCPEQRGVPSVRMTSRPGSEHPVGQRVDVLDDDTASDKGGVRPHRRLGQRVPFDRLEGLRVTAQHNELALRRHGHDQPASRHE